MKSATTAVLNILALDKFQMADLYTVTLADGTVLRLTSRDTDVIWSGNTYSCAGPFVERSSLTWRRGIEVDALTVTFVADPSHTVGDAEVPFLHAVVRGLLDGGVLTLQRAYWGSSGDPVAGVITLFTGRIGEITGEGAQIECEINSYLELLTQKMPRNTYSPGCRHTLFDAACGIDAGDFGVSGTVAAGGTRTHLHITGPTDADGYYNMGTLVFEDGDLAGQRRFIKRWASGAAYFAMELWDLPAIGDAVTLYPGCDKRRTTCDTTFDNEANFGGFPYVPDPEKAV